MQFLLGRPARGLTESAVGRKCELFGFSESHALTDSFGNVLNRFDVVALDIDNAYRNVGMFGDLANNLQFRELAACHLQVKLIDFHVKEVGEHRRVLPTPHCPSLVVSKAKVRRQATLADNRLDRAIENVDEPFAVCPTTVGGLIAVDTTKRRFLWGWAPPQQKLTTNSAAALLRARMQTAFPQPGLNWVDSPIMIANGKIVNPLDNAQVHCLDLNTGKLLWTRKRSDAWFVACVSDESALLVGKYRYSAIRLADGKFAWEDSPYRAIPAGGTPTGRGFFDGRNYYLPTTATSDGGPPELVQIDLESGKAAREPLERQIGNLAVSGGRIASVSGSGIELFAMGDEATEQAVSSTDVQATDNVIPFKERSVGRLIKDLADPEFTVREQASAELGSRGVEAIEALGRAAISDHPETAHRAVQALVKIKKLPNLDPGDSSKIDSIFIDVRAARNGAHAALPSKSRLRKQLIAKLATYGARVSNGGSHVVISRWTGQPEDLAPLRKLPMVTQLFVLNQVAGNDMIRYASGMQSLQWLSFQRSKVKDSGLAELKDVPKLQHLDLSYCEITDESVDKLASFKSVRVMMLIKTKLTADGIARLKKALPNARINGP